MVWPFRDPLSPLRPDPGARPLWVMMHIPKTAGATITAALSETLGPGRVLRRAWFDELLKYSKETGLAGTDMAIGHYAGRELSYLAADRPLRLFTFLRDPVERVLSNYRFWRQETPGVPVEDGQGGQVPLVDPALGWEEDLARILDQAGRVWKYRELTDAATWQLATSLYERDGISAARADRLARARLASMAFVGFQDRLEEGYLRFCRDGLGVPDPAPLPRINATDHGMSRDASPELIDRIRRANARDIALYDWARRRWG